MADETITCELCGGQIAFGSWASGGKIDGDSYRYLKIHQRRCKNATKAEREHYRLHGKWPHSKRRKKS